ncbi:MAG: hypothetical protein J0I28_12540 [Caulobacterales bacterium]|nr:hypothetical protein [Caulobacterales bacterium]
MSHPYRTPTGRVLDRAIIKLQRVRQGGPGSATLHFTFEGGGAGNSRCSFVDAEHVPAFDGEFGWFEIEKVQAKPWSFLASGQTGRRGRSPDAEGSALEDLVKEA